MNVWLPTSVKNFLGNDQPAGSLDITSPQLRKGKTKAKPELTPADYPQRVANLWKVGAHISAAGGVENAVYNAASIG
jgi:AP endonuclease-1